MILERYSIGVGDRFGMEGAAQLRALQQAGRMGTDIVPVWNKSNREHMLIGTQPDAVRRSADAAVAACGWKASYYVDADHIGLGTVDKFLSASDFYTIDVADFIGKTADRNATDAFVKMMTPFIGKLAIPGIDRELAISREMLAGFADQYLTAIQEAGKVYRYIAGKKREQNFIAEVSVDEAAKPQSPIELFFILAALASERVALQTIAPKFTGAFLKGIDYVGPVEHFAREFEDDLAVVAFAIRKFDLPSHLKLSIHSGSDKFSLYPIMRDAIRRRNTGLHLKTAGTTWLEEVIGLAASGGDGLEFAREIYAEAFKRYDELAKPYLPVINIDRKKLPRPEAVALWTSAEYVDTLRHDQRNPRFSTDFRQLVHIAFRVAAERGDRYRSLLLTYRAEIETNVTTNLFDRHIRPLFIGAQGAVGANPPRSAMTPADIAKN